MSAIAIVNGKLVDPDAPAVSVFDAAVLHGDAYFETLRTYDRRPALLSRHLDRLQAALAHGGFAERPTSAELSDEVAEAVNEFSEGDVRVRITVSRGIDGAGTRIVTAQLIDQSRAGLAATVELAEVPGYAYPHKSSNYQLQASLLRASDADEVLITDDGELIEGTTSNVFAIFGDELATPPAGRCLPGVTRGAVLEVAAAHGLRPAERRIEAAELGDADGVFLTNSLIELRPVKDHDLIEPLTQSLRALYREAS